MITQINTRNGRFYKVNGDLLPSVTTIIKATRTPEDCNRLRKWQHKIDKVHGADTADRESSNARNRGNTIHEVIAATLKDLSDAQTLITPESKAYWNSVKPIVKAIKNPCAVEHIIYHHTLKYAGTLDLIADWQGKRTIIDWKTSSRIKKLAWMSEAILQVVAYKGAYESMQELPIEQALVVVISPKQSQLFIIDQDEIAAAWYLWLIRLEQYKQQSLLMTSP
ncbi:PD-(D/E)XK nuclease family protein [Aliterella atlantica]|uniref:PD-(D/E)XK endonuclease-like domain-containing protein n=1 Tax=Aliterella atlantica CENA595 TaxID=1618023 RepID=A0A0D8ZPJ1_9CYAN|nr:PD-(D/E)XK nuclease family protein [Aliterella atlantica]KJH70252.1 hypothetical protein UH38_19070 [Aliterella atlantica CENA595]